MITYLGVGVAYVTLNVLAIIMDLIFKDGDLFKECMSVINDMLDGRINDKRYKIIFIALKLVESVIAWPIKIIIEISSVIFMDYD